MSKAKININSLYDAIKHKDFFLDKDGNIIDKEQYYECIEKIEDELNPFLEDLRDEIKELQKLLKSHIHQNGSVYIKA